MPGKIYKGRNYAPYPPANQTGLTVLCVALFLLATGLFGLYGYMHLYRPLSAIPKPSPSQPSRTFSPLGHLPASAPNPYSRITVPISPASPTYPTTPHNVSNTPPASLGTSDTPPPPMPDPNAMPPVDVPPPPLPTPPVSNGRVYITNAHLSVINDGNDHEFCNGEVTIVNDTPYNVTDYELSVNVLGTSYVLMPYEGTIQFPTPILDRTIAPGEALTVPVMTTGEYFSVSAYGVRTIHLEATLDGPPGFAEDDATLL